MTQIILPMRPDEATKQLLKRLPSRRMRDVLEKRFGLKGSKKKTLEAIGREYKITRERVRQIETDALKQLARPDAAKEVEVLLVNIEDYFREHGEVLAEHHFFQNLPSERLASHVAFLLHVGKSFHELPETANFHRRWTINKNAAAAVEKIMEKTKNDLAAEGEAISADKLHELISRNAESILGGTLAEDSKRAYLHTSKHIKENPYGEFGLASWPTINPRGVKDKAYLVLAKTGKPLHFRQVADAINELGLSAQAGWSKKKAHPQTVHNELIKDGRFVLVGRGLYALKDWGYEPGTVRDILVSVFKKAGRPLPKNEVIKSVLEKRFVKTPTILLNLQDRALFKRMDDERYTLV